MLCAPSSHVTALSAADVSHALPLQAEDGASFLACLVPVHFLRVCAQLPESSPTASATLPRPSLLRSRPPCRCNHVRPPRPTQPHTALYRVDPRAWHPRSPHGVHTRCLAVQANHPALPMRLYLAAHVEVAVGVYDGSTLLHSNLVSLPWPMNWIFWWSQSGILILGMYHKTLSANHAMQQVLASGCACMRAKRLTGRSRSRKALLNIMYDNLGIDTLATV